jgi:2-polyprenyl-3-methyl-5-hydroxy-6-metoxy-1,4-benzoquinol methylase
MSDADLSNHTDSTTEFENVLLHLKNKQIDVFATRRGIRLGVLSRLLRQVTRARIRTLRRGCQVVVSEQVVEVPLVLRHLRPEDRRVLDFGGFESLLPLSLAALGHYVTVLDQRPYPFSHPNLQAVCRDIFGDLEAMEGNFDAVVSISTIEHLGLGGYGDVPREDGDRVGVERLWSLVRPGGRLLATVPAGAAAVHSGYRVYDQQRLHRTFPHLSTAQWFRKEGREGSWHAVDPSDADQIHYQSPDASLPVEAVVFVICEKP